MIKSISILTLLFAISVFAFGCGGDEPAATETSAPPPSTTSETTGDVAFEPAYPEEVSTEGLSAEDTAQQQTHRHADGEVHAHDEKSSTTTDHGHDH
jgi:hypothetical protein